MDYETKIIHYDRERVMRELEEYLAYQDLVGEDDWPSWISY